MVLRQIAAQFECRAGVDLARDYFIRQLDLQERQRLRRLTVHLRRVWLTHFAIRLP